MAITIVVGAAVMTTAVDALLFDKTPLWAVFLHETAGLLAGNLRSVLVAMVAMLLVGTLIGLLNGVAVTHFAMPPFMVTLVSLIFFSAFAIYLTQSQNISNLPEDFLRLGEGDIVSVYFGEKVEP